MMTEMRPVLLRLLIFLCGMLCYGCSKDNASDDKQMEAISGLVVNLSEKTAMLESKMSVHDDLIHNRFRSARLDTTEPGRHFQRIDTDLGFFLVILDEVTPYLEGYRISLRIGNPSMVTYSGFSLKAKWGRKDPWSLWSLEDFNDISKDPEGMKNWAKANAEWKNSLQEKEFSFTEELQSGSWNKVEFVIAPAKAEELGLLEVAMDTNALTLHQSEQ